MAITPHPGRRFKTSKKRQQRQRQADVEQRPLPVIPMSEIKNLKTRLSIASVLLRGSARNYADEIETAEELERAALNYAAAWVEAES